MRFNSMSKSVGSLYRLLNACIMLYECKPTNTGTAHNYPKMILSFLLILEHWRTTGHYVIDMMKDNMSCVNEELGELTFSVLSRCVLGDTQKSNFEHMHKMYELLPVYMEVKQDVQADTRNKESIGWRHNIDNNSDEVRSTAFFFNRTIHMILLDRYNSYDGTPDSFSSQIISNDHLTKNYLPVVYITDISDNCASLVTKLKREVMGNFLSGHEHIWPILDDNEGDEIKHNDSHIMDDDEVNWDITAGGPDWELCKVGSYAISRSEFEAKDGTVTTGICVYKVITKNTDEAVIPNPNNYTFNGVELVCTVRNNNINCLDGQWNTVRNAEIETVYNYTIIVYFDGFRSTNRLLVDTINYVKHINSHVHVFTYMESE